MLLGHFTFGQLDLEQEELKLNDELLRFRKEFTKSGMDQASHSFASKMKSFYQMKEHSTIISNISKPLQFLTALMENCV